MHTGLENYYRWERNLDIGLAHFRGAWKEVDDRLAREYGGLYAYGIEEEWQTYLEKGVDMLTYYDMREQSYPLVGEIVDIAIEERAFIPIWAPWQRVTVGMNQPLLSGQIDIVVKRADGIWIVDHKTAGQPHNSPSLDVDDQLTAYCYIYWRLTGVVPRGAIYNVLLKDPPHPPKILKGGKVSQDKRQKTVTPLYLEACQEHDPEGLKRGDYTEFITMLKEKSWDQFFLREQSPRSQAQLEHFEERLYEEYRDMAEATRLPRRRYPNPTQFQCKHCPVLSICDAMEKGEDVEYIKRNGYVVKEQRVTIPEGI